MKTILPSDAVELVRKNLEELDPNGSVMYDDEAGSSDAYGDNRSLDDIIKRSLPEAINAVHKAAPVRLLEGEAHVFSGQEDVTIASDGVMTIRLGQDTELLRLVDLQAADSPIVVTDLLAEASPEGRKQLNPYIRGRADRPRVVIRQGSHDEPVLLYYSLSAITPYIVTDEHAANRGAALPDVPDPAPEGYHWWPLAITRLHYIKRQFYTQEETGYVISRMVQQNIIDYLTAMVMDIYEDKRAESFYKKAVTF